MGHLVELRNRFVIAAIAIVLGAVGGWFLYDPVLDILQEPIRTINDTSGRVAQINFAGVASAFDMKIKLSLFIGLFISCPVWLYQVWAYIVPGLTSKEKRYSFGFLGAAVPLFLAGSAMAFFALPNAVKALTSFTPEGATNIIPAQDYLTFVMIIIVVFGIAFVLPVLMVGLNMLGILSATRIRKSWRIIVMIVFIFAAIATPTPDAMSMFFLVIPMITLFCLAWVVCILNDRRRKRKLVAQGIWVDPDELDEDSGKGTA
ncbi:twin-arginine translocase subunit TatC [Brevibacterium casei]|uniref:Sec-independent protein translocase protein TatC n=4 Tax=Brevibacterium casei TaxID=33889 RepID=K9AQK8_9MICO|nr:twin-arginine translocase subunit TatC [Brevibacterium casei]EKU49733.1 Sec-independent protein translocase subunit TatC [Brevibacterium casei S18]PAK96592.1 twin-arginine translocase subunit TatC [Brevibacterium casei]SMX72915.1 sec-independent protein translocase protein TatC [Brevibacterium casei CIP 102111]VEW12140.1 Sec-independent protein translocase protein TatC [Brevibacterium casei]